MRISARAAGGFGLPDAFASRPPCAPSRPAPIPARSEAPFWIPPEAPSPAPPSRFAIPSPATPKRNRPTPWARFELDNVPFNPYHVRVTANGFQTSETDVDVKASVPLQLEPIVLQIGASKETVDVVEAGDLIETDPVTHTDVDRELFDKLPVESSVFVAELAGHAGLARCRRRLQRHVSRPRRSRLQLLLGRWRAHHRSAEQGLLQSAPLRRGAVHGSDRRRAAGRVRR